MTLTDCERDGHLAGVCGAPLDSCRLRRADRRAAWVRGWHAGQDELATRVASRTPLSPTMRAGLDTLLAALK